LRLWRITTRKWALDRLCDGARLYGGRWNPSGYPVMYGGSTIEICALEKFVHLAGASHPPLVLVAVDVPDALFIRPALADLPIGWADLPASNGAQEFGRHWLQSSNELVMLVPSAIIPESTNALINPAHPAYARVELTIVRDFTFDARMFKC
jgi:RES domain-containing protein